MLNKMLIFPARLATAAFLLAAAFALSVQLDGRPRSRLVAPDQPRRTERRAGETKAGLGATRLPDAVLAPAGRPRAGRKRATLLAHIRKLNSSRDAAKETSSNPKPERERT